jgi:hypothetical protein
MKRLLLALWLLLPATLAAETGVDSAMRLSVKPVLCITDSRTPRCDIAFLVVWESELFGYYCLFNDFGELPLRCWDDARQGRINDERSVSESFSYWMAGEDEQAKLAIVAVEVLRMDSDDRRRRRRTRHVWDIN